MNLPQFLAGRFAKGIVVLFAIAVLQFIPRSGPRPATPRCAGGARPAPRTRLLLAAAASVSARPAAAPAALDLPQGLRLARSRLQLSPAAPRCWTWILERLPATLLLTGAAFIVSLALGTLMGALAARRAGRWQDSLITTLALVFYATPLLLGRAS